ncbi:MAG: arginine--tRNA ligase [Bacteroidota bacterium]|nr:arginine--tRNA ligase [Bacteroidota bacterium]
MQDIKQILIKKIIKAIREIYQKEADTSKIQIQATRKDFEGDYTLVVFPLLAASGKAPLETATEIGKYIKASTAEVSDFNVVTGFLNLTISEIYWQSIFEEIYSIKNFGFKPSTGKKIVIEYSSPNTNKPLHLGHMRNNFLGWSVANILSAAGHDVAKVNLVNDRGIHICKSMLAWQELGNGETPKDAGMKGDKFVGKYYVLYNEEFKKQKEKLMAEGLSEKEAEAEAPWTKKARSILRRWERGHKKTRQLWEKMNNWVYDGFDVTYSALGINFDKIYHESDTYLKGKEIVLNALKTGELSQREDSTVYLDLTEYGMDEKVLLRGDGTTVYMTQDIGTAIIRYNDFKFDESIYVVGNEQDYHFKVLSVILDRLEYPWSNRLTHLSYGMVELPEGKMKSREGTVVDADDLLEEMITSARTSSEKSGKLTEVSDKEKKETYRKIALAALKFFILKVDSKKNMVFNPKESIDFNGHTGPFIQYAYVRIQSLLNKANNNNMYPKKGSDTLISKNELELVKSIYNFSEILELASKKRNPSIIANYLYDLAGEYNSYYHNSPILKEEDEKIRNFRIILSEKTAEILKSGLSLLGIEVPERM